ncbi:hypothetical protein LWI28_003026 [Acer negundo]|uniref:Uncharacterized protein n=1 Tax=Acer negundo TaxID=4023 RepID=A0AAD5JD34_ACENE|nr:hypothetical protein LWI28_003026 [Acer negundo]
MDTRSKSNAEFRTEVSDVLTRHESSFDHLNNNFNNLTNNYNQVTATMQSVLTELQALRLSHRTTEREVNPFAPAETSQTFHTTQPSRPATNIPWVTAATIDASHQQRTLTHDRWLLFAHGFKYRHKGITSNTARPYTTTF